MTEKRKTYKRGQGRGLRWLQEHIFFEDAECLIFPFTRDDQGYGQVGINRKVFKANRIMCELVNGPAPTPKHIAAHSCGKGRDGCVHPKHLSWKTQSQNQLDRREDGTKNVWGPYGKTTPEQRAEIRSLAGQFTQKQLAERFGLWPSRIWQIINRPPTSGRKYLREQR
jgi:hypothetical protein